MMTTAASRDDWAAPLAALIASIRHVTGGLPWDVPGIRAELHRAKHAATPDRLAIAAIEWAVLRRDLRAPTGLADDGPWWHTGRTPDTRVAPARCRDHEHELAYSCRTCASNRLAPGDPPDVPTLGITDEQAERNARGAAVVLAALADPPPAPPTEPDAKTLAAGEREDD